MLWLKTQSRTDRKLSQMHNLLARSFSNVKNDTQKLFQWMNYLYQKNQEQQNQIKQLKIELSYIPKTPEEIKRIVDGYYSFSTMSDRINNLNQRVDNMAAQKVSQQTMQQPIPVQPELSHIEQRLQQLEQQKQATIREKVVQRVTRNSKEYVKNLIIAYIRKYTQISGLQLKDMIVHDQGLCSKSSFYRLLEEIERLNEIGIAKKGREKYYLYKQLSEQ